MIFYFAMVNAWSLAGSILNGTFEEDYPIMDKTKGRWSEDDEIRELDDYYEDTVISPLESDEYDIIRPEDEDELIYENQYYETDYMGDTMADVDDQRAHHFKFYETEEKPMAHFFKYHEKEILKDIEDYVSRTYQGHYTGNSHEFRNVQTLDLMAAKELASGFCQANILKYGSRYGNKDGKNTKDLMKVIHYAMLLLHFDGHYGEPSVPSDDFEQMP